MSLSIISLTDGVVTKGDVNTLVGDRERVDIPTHEEELALLVYEEDFRQPELAKFLESAKSREEEIWEEEEFRWQDRAETKPAVYDFEDELQRREESDVPNALDHAMNSALSQGFTIDESSDGQERWAHLSA
tara:strand:+ start:196 stop:591 length:396 start_codon:yes stop_codon:yes gene_type:complete